MTNPAVPLNKILSMKILYLPFLLLLFSCTNPAPQNTIRYTRHEYPGKWPFSVNEIEVYCSGYKEIYCRASDGKTYALNGTAKGVSHDNPNISKVEEIWLDDPDFAGLKISYGDFITEGLVLCEHK